MSKAGILIVEDEAIVAADLANKLEQLGYRVVDSTDTGEEAIRLAGKLRPSLVLMDIRLAGAMDGIEAAKAIRLEWNLPVVFLTAHSEWATLQRAGEAEAFGYLLKPFHERELGTQIAMALYKHAAEGKLRESEERLRLAASAARFGSYSYDLEQHTCTWSPELYKIHGLNPGEPITLDRVADMIHPEDRPRFRALISNALEAPEGAEHYEGEFRVIRPDNQLRWLADRGRIIFAGEGITRRAVRTAGMVVDVTERKQAEEQLRHLNDSLEQQVAQQTEMLSILQDITRVANEAHAFEDAFGAALERIARYNGWRLGHVWSLAGDRSRQMVSSGIWYTARNPEQVAGGLEQFKRICEQTRFSAGEGLIGAVMESRQTRWIDDIEQFKDWRRDAAHLGLKAAIAFPVLADGELTAVLEFFSDQPTAPDERFLKIMPDIGIQLGHVIERQQLQQAIDTATTRQMRSIAHELHDGVAQQLTGSAMMTQVLLENLQEAGSQHVAIVEKLDHNLRDALNQVRMLSQGLMPVEIDAEGLMQALQRLVQDYRNIYGMEIRFQYDRHVAVENNDAATHLYRIAQEAILNAVKHGTTSQIEVHLGRIKNEIVLIVQDDGGGFHSEQEFTGGSGVRIMQHRASLIGGQLKIESEEGVGVKVTCRVRQPESAEW